MDVMFEEEARATGRFPSFLPPAPNVNVPAPRALPAAPYDEYDEHESPEMEAKGFTSLEEMKKEYDKKNKSRDLVSAKLGERMLSGWIMLNKACENDQCASTPLMCKSSDKARMECVSCGTVWTEDKHGNLRSTTATAPATAACAAQPKAAPGPGSRPTLAPSASTSTSTAASEAHYTRLNLSEAPILNLFQRSDPNAPSELLAAKMLKGWALLEQCCQKDGCAGIPLVRDKSGVVQCVVCNQSKEAPAARAMSSTGTAAAVAAAKPVAADLDESDEDEEDFEAADDNMAFSEYAAKRLATLKSKQASVLQQRVVPVETAKAVRSTSTKAVSPSHLNIHSSADSEHSLQFVSSVLKSQLRNAAARLEGAGAEAVGQASALADLITKLAVALKAVEGI